MIFKNPFKKKNKQEKNTSLGTCIWVNEVGSIKTRVFTISKHSEKGKLKISFNKDESYIIKEGYLRAKRIMMYKTSSGKVIPQNPEKWKDIDLKKSGIKELRFNLQNFSLQEGKASIHRWTTPKDLVDRLSPLFKLLFICIAVCVIGWAILKFGAHVLDVVMKSRLMDCSQIIPKTPAPIDAIANAVANNSTAPIGA